MFALPDFVTTGNIRLESSSTTISVLHDFQCADVDSKDELLLCRTLYVYTPYSKMAAVSDDLGRVA